VIGSGFGPDLVVHYAHAAAGLGGALSLSGDLGAS
jgi:hypothetical protein